MASTHIDGDVGGAETPHGVRVVAADVGGAVAGVVAVV